MRTAPAGLLGCGEGGIGRVGERGAFRRLEDQSPAGEVEGLAGRGADLLEALAQAGGGEGAGAVVAHRVVAGAPQDRVRHPGAARPAAGFVIAAAAKAPGPFLDRRPDARLHRRPDLGERRVADVAAAIFAFVQRRAALDRAVGFDRQAGLGGAAAVPISGLVGHRPPEVLVRSVIADIVAGEEAEAGPPPLLEQPRQGIVDLGDLPGLEDEIGLLGGVAGGHGQLDLPQPRAGRVDLVERLLDHRRGQPVDLGVAARNDAGAGQLRDRRQRLAETAGDAAQPVVHLFGAVDRDAGAGQARRHRRLDLGAGQGPAPGLQAAADAGVGHRLDDVEPIAAQIGLAADQADLPRAEHGEVRDHRADFVERELVAARAPGARAAMGAAQIAGERQLPDDMDGMAARAVERRAHPHRLVAGGLARHQRVIISCRCAWRSRRRAWPARP